MGRWAGACGWVCLGVVGRGWAWLGVVGRGWVWLGVVGVVVCVCVYVCVCVFVRVCIHGHLYTSVTIFAQVLIQAMPNRMSQTTKFAKHAVVFRKASSYPTCFHGIRQSDLHEVRELPVGTDVLVCCQR